MRTKRDILKEIEEELAELEDSTSYITVSIDALKELIEELKKL